MRTIETQNDDHVFKVGIKDKHIFVDGFELASRCSEIEGVDSGEAKPEDIANAMLDVAWSEDNDLSVFNRHELFSAGTKVLVAIDTLGKQ